MNILAIDIGGTNAKMLVSGKLEPRKFPSGPKLTRDNAFAFEGGFRLWQGEARPTAASTEHREAG